MKVGLIGTGRIGQIHCENLSFRIPEASLTTVTDAIPESARRCADDFRIPNVASSAQAVFEDESLDAVIICSSTDTHPQLITQAALAGKHIFCEKPIALSLAEIDRALEAVEKAGVKLQVGFNRRFDPNFQKARQLVAQGKVGTPHLLRITSRDPAPPPVEYIKVSGGIFLDMTIHDFDMARYLLDDEVEEVFAAGNVLVDPAIGEAGDIDTAVVTLRFAGGALGTIDNSRKAVYGYDQRVEVFGSAGSVMVGNEKPHNAVHSDAEGVHSALPLHFFLERYAQAYLSELQAFVESVTNDTPPPVTARDGRMPLVIGLAAWKSYRENRPVRISEID